MLADALGRDALKLRKERIKQIVNGEATGKAAREIIEACEAAVVMAAVLPAVVAGANH